MTKNQSLCFLKSKTNRTDYWVFPSNAKRRPIAVISFSHTSQIITTPCMSNKQKIVFEFDRTAVKDHAWKFLAEITDNTVTIFWRGISHELDITAYIGPLQSITTPNKDIYYFIQTQYLLNWMISLPENCCFSVEIKKIIGYFRFHNNTSASFRDQTVQTIRNFEMSRSLKPINDAPEFEINGTIFKIACNGFIFFAKLFINV